MLNESNTFLFLGQQLSSYDAKYCTIFDQSVSEHDQNIEYRYCDQICHLDLDLDLSSVSLSLFRPPCQRSRK